MNAMSKAEALALLSEVFQCYEDSAVRSELELMRADELSEKILDAWTRTRRRPPRKRGSERDTDVSGAPLRPGRHRERPAHPSCGEDAYYGEAGAQRVVGTDSSRTASGHRTGASGDVSVTRLLAALVFLGLAALMLAGSLTEVSRARREPVPRQIERPRAEQPLQRRRVERIECIDPGDFVALVVGCA